MSALRLQSQHICPVPVRHIVSVCHQDEALMSDGGSHAVPDPVEEGEDAACALSISHRICQITGFLFETVLSQVKCAPRAQ